MTRFRLINWWISHKFENLRFFFTGGGILVCLAGIFGEMPFLAKGGAEFLLVVFLVILIHENLRRFWLYLENHQESCRLPTEQMKRVNAFLLGCFLAVFLGLTVFSLGRSRKDTLAWNPGFPALAGQHDSRKPARRDCGNQQCRRRIFTGNLSGGGRRASSFLGSCFCGGCRSFGSRIRILASASLLL